MNREAAFRRLAQRALNGAEGLPPDERIQLFSDVAYLLPRSEAQVARDTAFALRESLRLQSDFLSLLTEAKS